MELFTASNQWATRPADERFWTVQDAHQVCLDYRQSAEELVVPYRDLRVEADDTDLRVQAPQFGWNGVPQPVIGNYAFEQLCQRGTPTAPPKFLRSLKPTLAAQVLNSTIKARGESNEKTEDNAHLLMHKNNGQTLLRASLSEHYSRVWNSDIFARLLELPGGWRVPPARPAPNGDPRARRATEADVLDGKGFLSVNVGDMIAPAGVYASDHDMFVFMVNEERTVDSNLKRGFFVWNGEVGDRSFGMTTFLYNDVCGNHIVWGASGVREIRVSHIKSSKIGKVFADIQVTLTQFADESVSDDRAQIASAKNMVLGIDKKTIVDSLFDFVVQKRLMLPKAMIDAGYQVAEQREDRYGPPNTMWAVANGITEYSQTIPFADKRNQVDRAVGRLLTTSL